MKWTQIPKNRPSSMGFHLNPVEIEFSLNSIKRLIGSTKWTQTSPNKSQPTDLKWSEWFCRVELVSSVALWVPPTTQRSSKLATSTAWFYSIPNCDCFITESTSWRRRTSPFDWWWSLRVTVRIVSNKRLIQNWHVQRIHISNCLENGKCRYRRS